MNLYYELLKKPLFTLKELEAYYENPESARTALKRLITQGLAKKIRNNLYTCISGETESPLANRYQIACAITESAYLSHHTAMEYYGVSEQVYYEVYVSSEKAFKSFEFDGYTYRHMPSKCKEGIEAVQYSGGVCVTDKERTVIDSIKDMDKVAGLEEVLANVSAMPRLDETKLVAYLSCYQNQFLYQKTGFLLQLYQDKFMLSDAFFSICRDKIGLSKRYLTKEMKLGKYDKAWGIIVPDNIQQLKNGE